MLAYIELRLFPPFYMDYAAAMIAINKKIKIATMCAILIIRSFITLPSVFFVYL